MDTAWLRQRGRIYWYDQYALNEQAVAFARYDPDRIAAELVGTGADISVLYAANQFSIAYYPSAIWPQHPNLHGRDYFGDLISRRRRAGKKVVAWSRLLIEEHLPFDFVAAEKVTDRAALARYDLVTEPGGG
jgi:hypothetical protein